MKFNVLCNNLFVEQEDASQPPVQDVAPQDNIPTPDKFDDVEPMPVPDTNNGPIQQILNRILAMAKELNDPQNPQSIQNQLFDLEDPNSIFAGISKLSSNVNRAAESLLTITNEIATLMASAKLKARDLAKLK